MGYDGKPLLYLSQLCQLTSAIIVIKILQEQLPFKSGRADLFLKITASLAVALILFSPVQAWAMVRATYLESYFCVLGGVTVISGMVKRNWWAIAFGLLLSMISTPGWMVLILLFTIACCITLSSYHKIQDKSPIIMCAVIVGILCGYLLIYKMPFDHPNNHIHCPHPSLIDMLRMIFWETLFVIYHCIAFLGFPMGWSPGWIGNPNAVPYIVKFQSAFIMGCFYLAANTYFIWDYFKYKKGSEFAFLILLWTFLMAGSITVSRVTVLNEAFVVNYIYPVYIITGWAVLLYLIIHRLGALTESNRGGLFTQKNCVIFAVIIGIFLSYAKGAKMVISTTEGLRYHQTRYKMAFIEQTENKEQQEEIAKEIYRASPDNVITGTRMLSDLRGIPEQWEQ
ncbi:MAG: hypothetical protein GY699_12900 [Desulfobacteraceae bacterium]|nr:hypothetical protein [Desulfobacteraceae bacterium]